jgi:hypothetical protein
VIVPASGRSRLPIRFSSVLFPDPDGPVIVNSSDAATVSETPRSASIRP